MKTTTTINFYCRSSKADKNGESPIEVAITLNGVRKFFTTNLRCDEKSFRIHPPQYVTKYLDSLRLNLSQTIADLTCRGIPLTADKLRQVVQKGGLDTYTIQNLFDEYTQLLKKRVRNGQMKEVVARRYKYVATLFGRHFNTERELSEVTPSVIENFYLDLKPQYEESSLAAMITRLKTIFKYAINNNLGGLRINPFQNIKVNKHRKDIKHLTEEEIYRVINLDIPNKSLSDVRDVFCLQMATGLAYTDVAHLSKSDIKIDEDGTHSIIKNRQKTNTQFTTIVLPWGVDILKKHDYHLRIISNQKMNAMLKTIQIMAGIQTTMTTHLARKTFASYLIGVKRVRAEIVQKALGHSDIRQTLSTYARIIDTQVIDELKGAAL